MGTFLSRRQCIIAALNSAFMNRSSDGYSNDFGGPVSVDSGVPGLDAAPYTLNSAPLTKRDWWFFGPG
jgi:hypothetical protein